MATLKLGTTTAITESSGTITVPALGTVTSGNLSNTAIVYPAGHVINTFEYVGADTSTTASGAVNTHVLGTATGTSALSSSSNKLLIHASATFNSTSTTAGDHWRLFVTGTGISHFTHHSITGVPFNQNYHYGHGFYTEDRYSITVLCSPGTTTPTYNIHIVEAGDHGTFATKNTLFQYQEIQV